MLTKIKNLDVIENKEQLNIVKIGAEWCPPCKQLDNILDSLSTNIYKIDIDESPNVAEQFSIRTIPVMLFMKDNKVIEQTGLLTLSEIEEKIEQYK